MVGVDGKPKPSDKSGIYIFDLANAVVPKQIGFLPVTSPIGMDLANNGDRLYVYSAYYQGYDPKDWYGVSTIDIADPKSVHEIAKLELDILHARLSFDSMYLFVRQRDLSRKHEPDYSFDIYSTSPSGKLALQRQVKRQYSFPYHFFPAPDGKHLLVKEHDYFVVYNISDASITKENANQFFDIGSPTLIGKDGTLYWFGSNGLMLTTSFPEEKMISKFQGRFGEGDGSFLDEQNKTIYLATLDKTIYVIDLADQRTPKLKAQYSAPTYIGSLIPARTNDLIYAGLLDSIVVIDPTKAGVTSEALVNAHSESLKQYKRKDLKLDYQRVGNAVNVLEAAGIKQSIDKIPQGMSNLTLAGILNDYGFFLSKSFRNKEAVEIFERVIQLNPDRTVAYLNLGDSLRSQLPTAASPQEKIEMTKRIKSAYQQFKQHGGQYTTEINSFMTFNIVDFPKMDICEYIATYTNQGRLREILGSGESVVKADGKGTMRVNIETQGTANMPSLSLIDNNTNQEITQADENAMSDDDDETRWVENIAVVPFSDGHHLLYFNDGDLLVSSSPIGLAQKNGHSCKFKTHLRETFDEKSSNQEICRLLQKPDRPSYVAFDDPDSVDDKAIQSAGMYETSDRGAGHVDFDNDGTDEYLAYLQYASGAGRGCDYNFFDLLNTKGDGFSTSKKRALLRKLQGVGDMPHVRHPVPSCSGNATGWFQYNGITYFETKYPGDEPTRAGQSFHTVSYIKNGEITKVCEAQFRLLVEVQH